MAAKFEVVGETPDQPEAQPNNALQKAAIATLLLGLKTLSQRVFLAVIDSFMLLTVGSAFWLWYSIPTPNVYQLIELAMYGVFVLAANYIQRRK